MMPPVLEQAGSFGFNPPVIWIWDTAPHVNLATKLVYDGVGIILLRLCRNPFAFIKDQLVLLES
jgi:hypothetical protein